MKNSDNKATPRDFGGAGKQPKARTVHRRKALKIVLVSLIVLLLLITSVAAAVLLPLLQAYKGGYADVPVVSNPGSFFIPPFNSGTVDPTDTWLDSSYFEEDSSYFEDTEYYPPDTNNSLVPGTGIYQVDKKDPDIENILLVGTDSRDMSSLKGRSDTMIICSYNRRTGTATLTSLMRDMLVYIQGYGYNRINASYSFGGIALCINTINQIFDLDIQRFVIINFEGTKKLVDACGGVDLKLTDTGANNEKTYIEQCGGFVTKNPDGTYHLNGQAALIHSRQRKGSSDFTRVNRQRNVITAIFRQVVASRDLTEIYDLVRVGFGMIKTNIKLDELIDLAASVVSNGANMSIGSYRIPTTSTNIYYHIGKQMQVGAGQGGASVLKIDFALQAQKVNEYIYGKK